MLSYNDKLKAIEEKAERARRDAAIEQQVVESLPDLSALIEAADLRMITVCRVYGAVASVRIGDDTAGRYMHSGRAFTIMEALRIMERFEVASVAVYKNGCVSVPPSWCDDKDRKGERVGSYFPGVINAEAEADRASLEFYAQLKNGLRVHVHIALKEPHKFIRFAPKDKNARDWNRVGQWETFATLQAAHRIFWYSGRDDGKSNISYFFHDAHDLMKACGVEIEGYTTHFYQGN